MAYKVVIKLASWKDTDPEQQYRVDNINQLADLLYNLLATRFDPFAMEDEDIRGTYDKLTQTTSVSFNSRGDLVVISFPGEDDDFIDHLAEAFRLKTSFWSSSIDFLKKIFNPFRWGRHGLSFAAVAVAVGVGLSLSNPAALAGLLPTLAGITALGITVGLPMLLIAGLAETILEYRQARKDIRSHAYAAGYFLDYGFFSHLGNVIRNWGSQHKGQATIIGFGVVFFIAALILTIPYCIDPTGSFSFMSTVLDPIIHFLSQGIDALAAMPQFEFLSALQQPVVELGIAAGLLISTTLAVPLGLKNFIQGAYEVKDSSYCYEVEDVDRQNEIDEAYNADPETDHGFREFCSAGFFIMQDSPYSTFLRADRNEICKHEQELVIR